MAAQTEDLIIPRSEVDWLLQVDSLAVAWEKSAGLNFHKPAVFWGDEVFSYGRLWHQSVWMCERIRKVADFQPGCRIGILLKNDPRYLVSLYGILLAGAVVVPINHFLRPEEVRHIVADSRLTALIAESSAFDMIHSRGQACPGVDPINVDEVPAEPAADQEHAAFSTAKRSDLALLIYTSGTTGRPKGAMLSHGNLLSNVESCRIMLLAVSHDRFVLLLPMFHSFMLTVCELLPLLIGGSVVLIRSVHPPKAVMAEIFHRGATILPAIPPFFRTLAANPLPPNFPLRLCVSGAAPLPGEVFREWHANQTLPLLEGYGLSEASPVVSLNPIAGPHKQRCIGVPVSGVEVTVQSDEGLILGVGEVGEIAVRGGNVMLGYWNNPEATAAAMRNGWLLTGDIGYGDVDGYFFITDRKKDMILVNGSNVYPREIEEVICQFPGVREAAVVGKPDERRGEHPVAFIVAHEGQSPDLNALSAFVRERLADYKKPRHYEVLEALPRNATGKVLKTALRAMLPPS